MKYENKKFKRLVTKLSSEGDEREPFDSIQKRLDQKLTIYSRGGRIERSHSKRVGNIINKSIENRYDVASKALKRIKNRRQI